MTTTEGTLTDIEQQMLDAMEECKRQFPDTHPYVVSGPRGLVRSSPKTEQDRSK